MEHDAGQGGEGPWDVDIQHYHKNCENSKTVVIAAIIAGEFIKA